MPGRYTRLKEEREEDKKAEVKEEPEQVAETKKDQESLEETERKNIKDDHGLPKLIEIQTETENTSDFTIKTGDPEIPFRQDDANLSKPPSTSGHITRVATPMLLSPLRPPISTHYIGPHLGQYQSDTRQETFEEIHLPQLSCDTPNTDEGESPEDDKSKCSLLKNCIP